jgi:hypothetical protein
LKLIAWLGAGRGDHSRRKFERTGCLPVDGGDTERAQIPIGGEHSIFSVEKQDIDTKAHPEGVNPIGRSNEKAVAGRNTTAAHKAEETSERCIRNSNPISEKGSADRIGDAQELSGS